AQIEALALDWDERFDEARQQVHAAIARLDTGEGGLVLTDMFGSTPSNVAVSCSERGRVEILSGVNLPMLLRLACLPQPLELPAVGDGLQGRAQKSVCRAREMPAGRGWEAAAGGAGTTGDAGSPGEGGRCRRAAPVALGAEKGDG